MTEMQRNFFWFVSSCWDGVDDTISKKYEDQGNALSEQIGQSIAQHAAQRACEEANQARKVAAATNTGSGVNPIRILGGEDFPQNQTITLNINGALFTGSFSGELFTYLGSQRSSRSAWRRLNRQRRLLLMRIVVPLRRRKSSTSRQGCRLTVFATSDILA